MALTLLLPEPVFNEKQRSLCTQHKAGWPALGANCRQLDAGPTGGASTWLEENRPFGEPESRPAKEASRRQGDEHSFVELEAVFMENKGFLAKQASVYANPVLYLAGHESLYANPEWYFVGQKSVYANTEWYPAGRKSVYTKPEWYLANPE